MLKRQWIKKQNNCCICRIRALNRIGTSEPGELKDVVVPKDPWGEFFFYFLNVKKCDF